MNSAELVTNIPAVRRYDVTVLCHIAPCFHRCCHQQHCCQCDMMSLHHNIALCFYDSRSTNTTAVKRCDMMSLHPVEAPNAAAAPRTVITALASRRATHIRKCARNKHKQRKEWRVDGSSRERGGYSGKGWG